MGLAVLVTDFSLFLFEIPGLFFGERLLGVVARIVLAIPPVLYILSVILFSESVYRLLRIYASFVSSSLFDDMLRFGDSAEVESIDFFCDSRYINSL